MHTTGEESKIPRVRIIGLAKFLTYLVIFCFERRCLKQNTPARLKSKYVVPPKFWLGYDTGADVYKLRNVIA